MRGSDEASDGALARTDVYVRLGPRGPRWQGAAESPASVVFVDLLRQPITRLRAVPQAVLRRVGTLLVRAELPEPTGQPPWVPNLEAVRDIVERLKLNCAYGLIHQPVGLKPRIETQVLAETTGDGRPLEDTDDLIRRARAVELDALLRWGSAIWAPTDYHFRLPSGDHSATFVKLADAIRQPRDAHVIASWLRVHLRDDLGIVCDTAALVAVIESLRSTVRAEGLRQGVTAVLDEYPASALSVRQAVDDVAGTEGQVLALLSVDASGRVGQRLLAGLESTAGKVRQWDLEVLVARERLGMPHATSWLPGPTDETLLEEPYGGGATGGCQWCRQPKTSQLVPVNPITLDGLLPAQIVHLMLDTRDAGANRELWELCSQADAVGLLEKPDDAVAQFRASPNPMAVHFRVRRLVALPAFRDQVTTKVRDLVDKLKEPAEREGVFTGEADLVLVAEHEWAMSGFNELWKNLRVELCGETKELATFPLTAKWPEGLRDKVAAAQDIVVLALGLVSGGSVVKALTSVQNVRADQDFELSALVVHARPTEKRLWESLNNAYGKRLHAIWTTFMPERSPLDDEDRVLEALNTDTFGVAATAFHSDRGVVSSGPVDGTRYAADQAAESKTSADTEQAAAAQASSKDAQPNAETEGGDGQAEVAPALALFWGQHPHEVVSPRSWFGRDITDRVLFAAVGSAMESARQSAQARAAPEVRVFELPALLVSYYDPMILAAVLRWVEPTEAWWGDRPDVAQQAVERLLSRAQLEPEDLRILLPELLLAAAQGKVPRRAIESIVAQTGPMLAAACSDSPLHAALEVGLSAVEQSSRRWPALGEAFADDA